MITLYDSPKFVLHGNLTYVREVPAGTFRRGKLLQELELIDRSINQVNVFPTSTMVEAFSKPIHKGSFTRRKLIK